MEALRLVRHCRARDTGQADFRAIWTITSSQKASQVLMHDLEPRVGSGHDALDRHEFGVSERSCSEPQRLLTKRLLSS